MEKYINAEMEIVLFDEEDVITTSGFDGESNPDDLPFIPAD